MFCRFVKHIGQSTIKELNRRKIAERAHRDRIRSAKIDSELGSEVLKRVEGMTGVKTFLIFAMTSLDLSVMTRRVWAD